MPKNIDLICNIGEAVLKAPEKTAFPGVAKAPITTQLRRWTKFSLSLSTISSSHTQSH